MTLPGDFGYDAISPDGATLYLTSYFSVERPEQYVVRSYDLAADRLDQAISGSQRRTLPSVLMAHAEGRCGIGRRYGVLAED